MKARTAGSCIRLPPVPTDALPGSDEKVRVLTERARLGVALWHPLDARLPADGPRLDARATFLASLLRGTVRDTAGNDGAQADECLVC
jgi:hypothetical protein